ncbi:hypothetical protein LCGC14_1732990 [marine sediment metagenome]|uniref:Uncharacterized protein n=1 Tax=marine sediment metagenome TaxID=412755 RepID=A0A0F9K8N4_9ZZZZ
MAEPSLRLTFNDFILRVAEHLSVAPVDGAGVAIIPTDAYDLEVCKRLVNDGFRRFYNSHPRWNWTLQTFTITFDPDGTGPDNVNSENHRYYMPDGFYGIILGNFTYEANSGYIDIVQTTEEAIRAKYASNEHAGYPTEFAIRPLHGDDKRRWEVIFWPEPTAANVVTARCRLYPNMMIELTDTPSAGFQFDEAILAAAVAEAERQREDNQGIMESQWAEALVRAVAMDQQATPVNLGDYGPGLTRYRGRSYTGVDSYTNQDGTVHNFTL